MPPPLEHQQTVLHDVDLDQRERGTGLVGHRVHGEVEGWVVRDKATHLQVFVAHQRGGT